MAESSARSWRIIRILTIVLGVVASVWSVLVTIGIVSLARMTYYLPPPPGASEAVQRHTWNTPTFVALVFPAAGLVLALTGLVLAARHIGTRGWVVLLPLAAITIASLGVALALAIPTPVF